MASSLSAALFVIVGWAILVIAGLPLAKLVFFNNRDTDIEKKENANDSMWALSPFVGYALITAALKILVRFDFTVRQLTIPVAIVVVLFFMVFVFQTKKQCYTFAFSDLRINKPLIIIFVVLIVLFSAAYVIKGADHFRGYGMWDNIYYGIGAEVVKEVPVSEQGVGPEARFQSEPWMQIGAGQSISRADIRTFAAFVATLCGKDGSEAIGFLGVLSTLLLFCALVYATQSWRVKAIWRYIACFFAATLPGLIIAYLESFLAQAMAASFAIVFCKLFYDTLKKPTLSKTVLCGVVFSSAITMYEAASYFGIAAAVATFIYFAIYEKVSLSKTVHFFVIFCISIALNFQYVTTYIPILLRFGERVGVFNLVLNHLYPFAFTPAGLTWLLFGTTFQDSSTLVARLGFLIAITVFVSGILGLAIMMKKKDAVAFSFAMIVAIPIIFLCAPDDLNYNYFKSLTMVSPIVMIGAWQFWGIVFDHISKAWFAQYKPHIQKIATRIVICCGTICIFAVCIVSSYRAFDRTMMVPRAGQLIVNTEVYRIGILQYLFTHENETWFDSLKEIENRDVLVLARDSDGFYYWMVYYLRQNNIFSLTDTYDDMFTTSGGYDFARNQYQNIPGDALIIQSPDFVNHIPEEYADDFAAVINFTANDGRKTTDASSLFDLSQEFHDEYRIDIFARYATETTLTMEISKESDEPMEIRIGGSGIVKIIGPQQGTVSCQVALPAGGSELEITSAGSSRFAILDWSLMPA